MSLLLGAAPPTPEPDPGWGVGVRRPARRSPLGAAILVVASLAYAPEAIAAPTPDILPPAVRVLPARRPAPARHLAVLPPVDGAHRADPGGWALVSAPPPPRAARQPLRAVIEAPEAPAPVVTPPAAGSGVPAIALSGRSRIIPRLAFVDTPPAVVAPLGTEHVLSRPPAAPKPLPPAVRLPVFVERGTGVIEPEVEIRPPAARRPGPLAARLPIVAPDPRPGGVIFPEVEQRPPAARRPLPVAVRGPMVPIVVVAPPDLSAPPVLVRAPAKRRPVTRPAGSYTDQGLVAPPTVFDCLHVAVTEAWPRVVPIALDSPAVVVTEAWPRVVDLDGC